MRQEDISITNLGDTENISDERMKDLNAKTTAVAQVIAAEFPDTRYLLMVKLPGDGKVMVVHNGSLGSAGTMAYDWVENGQGVKEAMRDLAVKKLDKMLKKIIDRMRESDRDQEKKISAVMAKLRKNEPLTPEEVALVEEHFG